MPDRPDIAPEAAGEDKPPTEKKRSRADAKAVAQKTLYEGVASIYGLFGAGLMLINKYDGTVILMKAEDMANSVIVACQPYPEAMRILRLIAKGNVWTTLFMVHLGPALAIAANHGVVSRDVPPRFGLPVPPEHQPVQLSAEEEIAAEREYAENVLRVQVQQQMRAQQYEQAEAQQAVNGAHLQAGGVGGPLGDAGEVAARRAFTEEQIARIRAEAIANALQQQQNGAGQ